MAALLASVWGGIPRGTSRAVFWPLETPNSGSSGAAAGSSLPHGAAGGRDRDREKARGEPLGGCYRAASGLP